jgi:hypothetical protein
MRAIISFTMALVLAGGLVLVSAPWAEAGRGRNSFRNLPTIDGNDNGACDRWEYRQRVQERSRDQYSPKRFQRDTDGDGIPNGQDEDYTRPLDGTGYQERGRGKPSR